MGSLNLSNDSEMSAFLLLSSLGDEKMVREVKGRAHIHSAGEGERRKVTPGQPHADPLPRTKAPLPSSKTCLCQDLLLRRGCTREGCLSSGCGHKIPQTGWLIQQAFLSPSSGWRWGDLRSGCRQSWLRREACFLICGPLPSHMVLIGWKERDNILWNLLRAFILS